MAESSKESRTSNEKAEEDIAKTATEEHYKNPYS
jgi:hypothetical protein